MVAVLRPNKELKMGKEISLWVFKADKSEDWFVELESEDSSMILRRFDSDRYCPGECEDIAEMYGNQVGKILGVPCVKTENRGM